MPAMANITVLDRAGANVVYTAVSPSAGDRIHAVWRANALSPIIGLRPHFKVVTRDNGKQNGRIIQGDLVFPVTGLDGVNPIVLAKVPLSFSGTLPTNVTATDVENAFVQFGNLIASALIRAVAAEGSSPT